MYHTEKSSSKEQIEAEAYIFSQVKERIPAALERNPKVPCHGETYIQPDFYSEPEKIIGEIFAHVGKPKKAQDNKIANDILKMLLLEKLTGQEYRKIIVVCDEKELAKLQGKSALAESIRQFGIELMYIELDEKWRELLLQAQERQRMVNG